MLLNIELTTRYEGLARALLASFAGEDNARNCANFNARANGTGQLYIYNIYRSPRPRVQ